MSTHFTSPEADRSPPSAGLPWVADGQASASSRVRAAGRRRSVPHLVLGVLLVVACTAGFVVVSVTSGSRRPVLALARAVTVGQVVTAQDLREVSVAVDAQVNVVEAGLAASVVGKTMATSLPAGALLTPEAVGATVVPAAGRAIAALSLRAGQFPPEVSPGTPVSVVFVAGQASASVTNPPASSDSSVVWPGVVTSVTAPAAEQTTVVSVQLSEAAARQVAAVPAGQLSLVMLPGGGR